MRAKMASVVAGGRAQLGASLSKSMNTLRTARAGTSATLCLNQRLSGEQLKLNNRVRAEGYAEDEVVAIHAAFDARKVAERELGSAYKSWIGERNDAQSQSIDDAVAAFRDALGR